MNIYISNISYSTQEDALRQLFETHGEVSSCRIITDKFSGRSRGFGFVEMPNDEQAQNAINQTNNFELDGKVLSVSEAKPREERDNRGGGYGGGNRGGGGYNRDRNSYGNNRRY